MKKNILGAAILVLNFSLLQAKEINYTVQQYNTIGTFSEDSYIVESNEKKQVITKDVLDKKLRVFFEFINIPCYLNVRAYQIHSSTNDFSNGLVNVDSSDNIMHCVDNNKTLNILLSASNIKGLVFKKLDKQRYNLITDKNDIKVNLFVKKGM
jgi:hypothetical protein